ncbi:MAG: phenylalanine--tRNA ligase subunit beta [Gemmatimonadaceae bacterium]
MNASYAWLKSFVPFPHSPAELRDLLTARAATVDDVVPLRADLETIVVGLVVEAAAHPDSDHLHVTKVDAGTGELLDVVCGAPNVRAGSKYPFAGVGTTLPGGLTLERRKIRGQWSNGMLCSARELQLGDEHDGILELDTDAAPGTPFLHAYPAGDTRLVIDVLPNRPDLLSHVGVAREIAAATRLPMSRELPVALTASVPAAVRVAARGTTGGVSVRLDDAAGCPRYMGVVIRGVRVAPSPAWLTDRLVAVGSRAINNIVDVTNYVMHESGQPMHAFDVAKLAGPALVIRRARDGETIVTLDGVSRALRTDTTVIADAEHAQAIAGVMGGSTSEVSDATTDLLLEVAHFDPASVRRARVALGLATDASYRFERYVDIENAAHVLERTAQLIVALAGGRIDGEPVDVYPDPRAPRHVPLRVARVERLLGVAVAARDIKELLTAVGFAFAAGDGVALEVTVPAWRSDVIGEIDLIEEVARLRGYESFPDDLRPFRVGTSPDAPRASLERAVRTRLVAAGLLETRSMPFVAGADEGFVRVANPLAANEGYLRREVLDTLARRAEYNLARMQRNVRLFEIGATFAPSGSAMPVEEVHVAALVMGARRPPHFTEQSPPAFDAWDAKALAEELLDAMRIADASLVPGDGDVLWNVRRAGEHIGGVSRVTLDAPVWAAPAFGIEIRLAAVDSSPVAPAGAHAPAATSAAPTRAAIAYRALPTTPSSEIDVALLVPSNLPAAMVEETIRAAAGGLLESLVVVDEYHGDGVPAGFRSIAWRLTFRDPARTLQSKEIAGRREKILRTLEKEHNVRQRSS